jgi:uncharacterized protein (DUF2249 family)
MSTTVVTETIGVASDQRDAAAAEAVVTHHAQMTGHLRALTDAVLADVSTGADTGSSQTRLVDYARGELLPHAAAEEGTIYATAANLTDLTILVDAMVREHVALAGVVESLESAKAPGDIAAAAGGLWTLFDSHLAKENLQVVPRLAEDPNISLADLVEGLHELVGGDDVSADSSVGSCGCGHVPDASVPSLDVTAIPHAIRHATVFGALDAVSVGSALILVAPHDPIPLLNQLEDLHPGRFSCSYRERGPQTWAVELTRNS